MLARFRVENFRSIRDQAELSLVATPLKDDISEPIRVKGTPHGLLRVAAIYGANASGKSSVLNALEYFSRAIANSHRRWKPEGPIPVEPFLLDKSREKPSLFEAEFILDNVKYRYGFVLDSRIIREEWLYVFKQGERVRRQEWFTRQANRDPVFRFGRNLSGDNRVIEKVTRPNSLFLSAAAQNNHKALLPIHRWLVKGITLLEGPRNFNVGDTIMHLRNNKNKNLRKLIERLLSRADLGVTGIQVKDEVMSEQARRVFEVFAEGMLKPPTPEVSLPEKVPHVQLVHAASGRGEITLPFRAESNGTVSLFALLGPMVETLANGGVLCVDELDSSLHPHLALMLVRMFANAEANTRGAQLIFNTHDTNLLDETVLRRDEVWFTEKDTKGCTHLYPLSDFAPRKNENLKRGYLQGRFGAIPFLASASNISLEEAE